MIDRWEGLGQESFEANDSATAYFDDNAQEIYERGVEEEAADGIFVDGTDGSLLRIATKPNQIKSIHNRGSFDPNRDEMLFQKISDRTEPFYSAAERAIENLKQDKFSIDQIRGVLGKLPGVRQEELDQMNFELLLSLKAAFGEKSVTKAELLETVSANKISVVPVTLERESSNAGRIEELPNGRFKVEYPSLSGNIPLYETRQGAETKLAELRQVFAKDTTQFGSWLYPFARTEAYKEIFLTAPNVKGSWTDGHAEYGYPKPCTSQI